MSKRKTIQRGGLLIAVCMFSSFSLKEKWIEKGYVAEPAVEREVLWPENYQRITIIQDEIQFSLFLHKDLYSVIWREDPRVKFWQKIITLSPDSGILNVAGTREIIGIFSVKDWDGKPESYRMAFRDSVRKVKNLDPSVSIYFTQGKNHFYNRGNIIPYLHQAHRIFEENGVDPFYAQAVLLVESPVRNQKSSVGAYGHFQLMKKVAVQMGLKVNKYVDEREDFYKCAYAAAKLFRTICIPETNKILDENCIEYTGDELWYKLLVLHVYHAGAYNVKKAVELNKDAHNGEELIKRLWNTTIGAFRNESQNYTQIILASHYDLLEQLDLLSVYLPYHD